MIDELDEVMREILIFLVFLTVAEAALRRSKPCVNGEQEGDKCFCKDGWTGALCHRKMNCEGYERNSDGSCVRCLEGWDGPDCDAINCNGHGEANYDQTMCHCQKPYSGDYCEKFTTQDIYSYYNNIASKTGAMGVISIVPLALIYIICDRVAKRRREKKVEDQLDGSHYQKERILEEVKQGLLAQQEDTNV